MPHALMWGVPYDIFFDLDLRTIKPFQESYRLRCREKADIMNHSAWLIGRYVCESIASCFGKNHRYPSEPYEERKETDENGHRFTDVDRFAAFASVYNANHKSLSVQNE